MQLLILWLCFAANVLCTICNIELGNYYLAGLTGSVVVYVYDTIRRIK